MLFNLSETRAIDCGIGGGCKLCQKNICVGTGNDTFNCNNGLNCNDLYCHCGNAPADKQADCTKDRITVGCSPGTGNTTVCICSTGASKTYGSYSECYDYCISYCIGASGLYNIGFQNDMGDRCDTGNYTIVGITSTCPSGYYDLGYNCRIWPSSSNDRGTFTNGDCN